MDRAKGTDWRLASVLAVLLTLVVSLFVTPMPAVMAGNGGGRTLPAVFDAGPAAVPQQQPDCSEPPLNFNDYTINPYSDQDVNPTMAIEDGGATLHISGNSWKQIEYPWVLTSDTILEFDFRSESEGEVQGIGWDDDNTHDRNHLFQLYGSQRWGRQDYDDYAGSGPGWKHYVIPIGTFYTGEMRYLTFLADDDASSDADSWFSDVRVCGGHSPPPTPTPTPTNTPEPSGRWAKYDNFEICPLGVSDYDVRPKPPGLRECGNVIQNSDFEPFGSLSPWVAGDEAQAVVANSSYSCDTDGRGSGLNKGSYSLLFKCDRTYSWPYTPYHPWAYQDFTVPAFVSTTEQVVVEMSVSLYYVVPPQYRPDQGPYRGTLGRAEDELSAVIQDPSGNPLTSEVVITHGAIDQRDKFHSFAVDMAPLFVTGTLQSYAGQTLRLHFEAPNPIDEGDSRFHIDQVKCEICTTVQEPEHVIGKVERLGGNVRVMLAGQAIEMQGVDVWATQLQVDGSPPFDQLDFASTYTIQDSTYSFYNLAPGRYRIYAEVWVSGNLYLASATVDVIAEEINTSVNLTLI